MQELQMTHRNGENRRKNKMQVFEALVKEIEQAGNFKKTDGGRLSAYKKCKSTLTEKLDTKKIRGWIKENIEKWSRQDERNPNLCI